MKRIIFSLLFLTALGAGCAGFGAWTPPTNTEPVQNQNAVQPSPSDGQAGAPSAEGAAVPPADAAAAPKPAPKPAAKKPAPAPKPANGYVTVTNSGFSPQMVSIMAGATVIWTNKGTVNQTVHSDGSNLYDSGNLVPGASYQRVFAYPGSYVYYSGSHPELKGTIVVR